MFRAVDADDNGSVEPSEFVAWFDDLSVRMGLASPSVLNNHEEGGRTNKFSTADVAESDRRKAARASVGGGTSPRSRKRGSPRKKSSPAPMAVTLPKGFVPVDPVLADVHRKFRAAAYTAGGVDFSRLFRHYDRDNSGSLGFEEFRSAVRRDAKVTASVLSDKELRKVFRAVDADDNGSVEPSEFVAWFDELSVRMGLSLASPRSGVGITGRGSSIISNRGQGNSDSGGATAGSINGSPRHANRLRADRQAQGQSSDRVAVQVPPDVVPVDPVLADVHRKFRAAAYTAGGVDFSRLFRHYDRDNSGSLGFEEFRSAVRRDAKVKASVLSDKELRKVFRAVDADDNGSVEPSEFVAWFDDLSVRMGLASPTRLEHGQRSPGVDEAGGSGNGNGSQGNGEPVSTASGDAGGDAAASPTPDARITLMDLAGGLSEPSGSVDKGETLDVMSVDAFAVFQATSQGPMALEDDPVLATLLAPLQPHQSNASTGTSQQAAGAGLLDSSRGKPERLQRVFLAADALSHSGSGGTTNNAASATTASAPAAVDTLTVDAPPAGNGWQPPSPHPAPAASLSSSRVTVAPPTPVSTAREAHNAHPAHRGAPWRALGSHDDLAPSPTSYTTTRAWTQLDSAPAARTPHSARSKRTPRSRPTSATTAARSNDGASHGVRRFPGVSAGNGVAASTSAEAFPTKNVSPQRQRMLRDIQDLELAIRTERLLSKRAAAASTGAEAYETPQGAVDARIARYFASRSPASPRITHRGGVSPSARVLSELNAGQLGGPSLLVIDSYRAMQAQVESLKDRLAAVEAERDAALAALHNQRVEFERRFDEMAAETAEFQQLVLSDLDAASRR